MTEEEMLKWIEDAKKYISYSTHIKNLLEIIEYQKGVGLTSWAENKQLKLELDVVKRANELQKKMLDGR
jgi:hypothetical protein